MDDVERLVKEHQHHVWRYLRLLGAPPADADDLLQETLVRFLHLGATPGGRTEHAPPAALLRRIARGLWVDRQRWLARRRTVQWADEVDQLLATTPDEAGDDWLDALARCRDRLTERARRALELAYRDGHGRAEIARELGLSPNTVRNLLASTRDALRQCIEARLTTGHAEEGDL
ncbi:MAG: RNA polymerase sigma factor [Planctomycetota bacterium]